MRDIPAYLQSPPIYENVLTSDNKMTDVWKNHLDNVSLAMGFTLAHDRFEDTKQETPLSQVVSLSTARRNQLQNALDGSVIYNTTTNRFNFRESGAWVTFTPIPA